MGKNVLFSIGHGTRRAEDFVALLKMYKITYLIDVRSIPYSAFNPQYSQTNLQALLENNGIRYVFMGDNLGGRPKDPACYNEGRVDYNIIKTKEFFRQGIARLKKAYANPANVAIMCSESKPQECHRCRLVGTALSDDNIQLQHIDEYGHLKSQEALIKALKKDATLTNLFASWTGK